MKCVVVDMRNRLFGDAISGSLQHFDSGFRVYQTEGTAAEDLCADRSEEHTSELQSP